jgi:hypothetical protein
MTQTKLGNALVRFVGAGEVTGRLEEAAAIDASVDIGSEEVPSLRKTPNPGWDGGG